MRRHTIVSVLAGAAGLVAVAALAVPAHATSSTNERNVTGSHQYTTVTGGSDPVTQRCSTDNRQQNETSLSIHPTNSNVMAAGANDYCTIPTIRDAWNGLYRSWDGGVTWNLTLIPGYPGDNSPAGLASPLHGLAGASGDPWDAFDNHGYLYVMGNAFNRTQPQNASVWVATFGPDAAGHAGAVYLRTVLLARGTPGANGLFNDKTALAVDNSGHHFDGTVYAAWSQFHGARGNNEVDVAVSHDGGRTFSAPIKVSQTVGDSQFADVAVGPDGTATVVWRTFSDRTPKVDSVVAVRSTDGGATWTRPATVATFAPYDKSDVYGSPTAAAAASSGPDGVDGEAAGGASRDCGDLALACQSGFTFYRDASQVRIAADSTGFHAVWNELKHPHATGTTYSPGGYSRVVYSHSANGVQWSAPVTVDQNAAIGHQTFPTVAAGGGSVTVGWNDSRNDACFSQERPAGNCPSAAGWVAPANGSLDTYVKRMNETTGTWDAAATRVSSVSQNPNWEQFGGRLVPFFGDYITAAYGGGVTRIDWTDNRDVPAQPGSTDGNDVLGDPHDGGACTSVFSTCFDLTRGEDQNLWIADVGN
ncbi:MAG: sialidase family protein [Jatrophihabitantaceae bacterium]